MSPCLLSNSTESGTGSITDKFQIIIDQIGQLSGVISSFNVATEKVDTNRFGMMITPIQKLLESINALSGTDGTDKISTLLENLKTLLSGEGENAVSTESFVKGLDGDAAAKAITDFVAKVGPALQNGSETLSTYKGTFNEAGGALVSSLSSGFSAESADTSGVSAVCGKLVRAADGFKTKFIVVGKNFTRGLTSGVTNGPAVQSLINAAKKVVQQAIDAAKQASEQNSPSKKFAEIGKGFDEGLVVGIKALSGAVVRSASGLADNAISSAKGALSNLTNVFRDDLEYDPVIRPVVDLSNVSDGARAIRGILSSENKIPVNSARSRSLAGAIGSDRAESKRNRSSATSSVQYDQSNSGNTNINVDKLITKNEDDVRLLALELSKRNLRLQFGYGG